MTSFAIASDAIPTTASVAGFHGVDALSEPFGFDVWFVVPGSAQVDLEAAVFSTATLSLSYGLLSMPHGYSGIFSEMELVAAVKGNALYRARLVPRFWLLGLSHHSRIFTKKSIRTVISEVLAEYGLAEGSDFEFRVSGGQAEEHVCQYKESDFAFVTRWLAREGWTYFFEHEDGKDKLVMADQPSGHGTLRASPIRYFPSSGKDGSFDQAFSDFACNLVAQPARVSVRDYDYAKPGVPIRHAIEVSGSSVGVFDDYGARVFNAADAERIAAVRAQRQKCRERTFSAIGAATHLAAGATFELDLHPRADFNVAYLATRVVHIGREPHLAAAWGDLVELQGKALSDAHAYEVAVEAVAADVAWKALETVPWPHVDSFENAIVDGAADSQYAQLDGDGRYAVKFHFDEGTLKDGKASTRVRMMQPHGGSIEGFHFPLRKGTEVVCAFLGGDVDRPFIQAVAPNAEKPSPVLASNRSQNILQTGSATHLTIEDQSGAEFINLFSPKEKSGLYLGVGRGEGGRALTSNAAPAVAPQGPGGMKLGPFSFDLRTDTGHAQLYTGQNLDIHAHGQLQRIAGDDVNVTMFGALDHDVVGDADEYYHQTLNKTVALKVTARHDDTRDFTVHFAATEKYDAVFDMKTVGPAIFTFLTGCDREITKGLTDYHYFANQQRTITGGYKVDLSPKNEVIVHGDLTQTVFGKKTEHITETLDMEITGVANIKHNAPNMNTVSGAEEEVENGAVFEASLLGKLDIVDGTHKEKWTSAHIEITVGMLASIFMPLVFETGLSASINLFGQKAELSGMDFSIGALGLTVEGQATELDASQVQAGLFTLTLKGFKLM